VSAQTIRDAWLWQAATCEGMDAPFSAAVLRTMAQDEGTAAAFAPILAPHDLPSARELLMAAMPLRILGGLHFLTLSGEAPALARLYASGETQDLPRLLTAAALKGAAVLSRFMTSPPQTNEVRRSLCLVGGFLEVARATRLPLRCFELGASAGLNMTWDLLGYEFGAGRRWGDPDAALTLSGVWTGGAPPLNAPVEVALKRGCDQAPIDVGSEEGALRLQAYIWPEQGERLERVRAAIELARRTGVRVETADALDFVRAEVDPRPGAATIVYHSIFIQYPPEETRRALIAAIEAKGAAASAEAPFAWLRMEPKAEAPVDVEVRLTLWPSGEERRLAEVHPHGASVHWP
jgi:hypothetical protein